MSHAAKTNIRIEHLTNTDQFDAIEPDWSRLHTLSTSAGFFNSWYWNRLWWEHYGNLGTLHIVVVYNNDVVEAIAPLYRCTTRALRVASADTIRFIGSGGNTSPDDLDVLLNPQANDEIIKALTDDVLNLHSLERLQFSDLPEHSQFLHTLLERATELGWSMPLLQNQTRCVQALPDTISAYEKSLSRNARKQRKRRRRKLKQAGEFKFHRCRSPEEIDLAFADLVTLHQTRHASKGEQGNFGSERYRSFHLALMKEALKRDELRLIVLVLNEKTIGIEYSFFYKGTIMFFQNGFDPKYEALSPGHLSMMHIIDEGIKEGARNMDLLKGEYEYKLSYAKDQTLTVGVDAWRSNLMSIASRAVRSIKEARNNEVNRVSPYLRAPR
ncbi:MAG: GNAT family N-acetyltransferase [Granulosicoccus sp.]